MSDTFNIETSGNGELQAILHNFRVRGQKLDRLLPAIGELLLAGVNDIVDMEGPGWDPLKESTLERRRKAGRGAKMLQDSGLMMTTLDDGFGPDFVEVKMGVPYGKFFVDPQYEASKRNPFDLSPIEDDLMEDVKDVLLSGLEG